MIKETKNFVLAGMMSLIVVSCNDDISTPIDKMEIETNAEALDIELLNDGKTIRIKDEETYINLLDSLASKTEQERKEFFETLSFKSQYILLNEADEELRVICETSNEQDFESKYVAYRNKYDDVFMFNEMENEDLSAYSRIINAENRYFANEDGLFYIGDSLVVTSSFNNVAEYLELAVTTRGSASGLGEFNHAWSHQSDRKVGLYISINGERININFTSQKKGLFGWVRYDTEYYAKFKLGGGFQFFETAYYGFPYEKYTNKDNIEFQINTRELSGNVNIYLGKVAYQPVPSRYSYSTSGTMEVWSRGVYYEARGKSSVSLSN